MSDAASDGMTLVIGNSAPTTARQSPAGLLYFSEKVGRRMQFSV